jgi:hypothetical protein
LSFNGEIDRI